MLKEKILKEHMAMLKKYGIGSICSSKLYLFKYNRGEFICLQGSELEHIFIFIKGRAKVFYTVPNGKTLLMAFYTRMGLIGDSELMRDEIKATSSVQAITQAECIAVPLKEYKNYLKNNIKFMNMMGKELANKLNNTTINSTFNILHPLDSRLCAYIEMTSHDGYFEEKYIELSEILGSSYRHLLRTFDKLCKEGILEKSKKGYLILDMKKLKQTAASD